MPAERKLSVVRDGGQAREVSLVGTVTVGRGPTCEISSSDPRLSRTHASFEIVDGEVVVRDLESSNGTTVNGAKISEHRLRPGEKVEIGPFVIELITAPEPVIKPRPANSDNEATVMMNRRAIAADLAQPAASPATPPPAAAAKNKDDSSTRLIQRPHSLDDLISPAPAAAAPPPTKPAEPKGAPPKPAAPRSDDTQRTKRPVSPAPPVEARPAAPVVKPAAKPAVTPATAPAAAAAAPPRPAATELTFANTALLWIVPVVLISFLAGLVPDLMQPDNRTPLLRAHYVSLATTATDLLKITREPAVPIDNVTTALRGQLGVTAARIVAADGRVLAPLDRAATTVTPPANLEDTAPRITETSDGLADIQVAAKTADGRPVMVAMTVDPERIHPAPPGSPLGTILLIVSLGAAWLVARRLTSITDSRLSRLGEEVELMTTRQLTTGRDPFSLAGGQRILDAVTFALSAAGRIASVGPRIDAEPDAQDGADATTASITADASFRIVSADRGCDALLGMDLNGASGRHLIDAFPDQAISDEVLRLVTAATPDQAASGEAVSAGGIRLAITVTKGAGAAPLSIRFKKV